MFISELEGFIQEFRTLMNEELFFLFFLFFEKTGRAPTAKENGRCQRRRLL